MLNLIIHKPVIVDLSSSCFVGRYTRRALGAHSSTEGDPKTSCTEHQESSSESTTKTSSRDAQETSRRPWKISLWQPHVCYWWWISSIASVHNQLQLEFTGLCNSGWTMFFCWPGNKLDTHLLNSTWRKMGGENEGNNLFNEERKIRQQNINVNTVAAKCHPLTNIVNLF